MEVTSERSAKRQATTTAGSPVRSALKSPSKHVIHSPPAKVARPVPETPPGITGAAAGPDEGFQALVMAKFREREQVEQNLVARVAVLEGKAARLEPLEVYTHDLSAIARVKHFVTNDDLVAKLDEVRNEALKQEEELELLKNDLKQTNALLNQQNFAPQQEVELVKSDLKEYLTMLNGLNEEFKSHVKGAFGIVEERYGTLAKDFGRITTSIAIDGSLNNVQIQQNLGNLQDAVNQKEQGIQQLKEGFAELTRQVCQLASSSPSSSTWIPGGDAGGHGPCHGRGAEHGGRLTALENWAQRSDFNGLVARLTRLEAAPPRDAGAGAPGAHAPRPFMQQGSWTGPCGMAPEGHDPHSQWPQDAPQKLGGINWAKLFDHKLAESHAYAYTGDKGGLSWAKKTRGYFISLLPDLMPILDWAAKEKTAKISIERVVAEADTCRWMIDCDARKAGGAIWGFLSSALSGKAQLVFEGTEDLNGFDAWRRLMQHIHQGENVHKGQLRNLVKNPPAIRSLEEVPLGIDRFEKIMRDYEAADGIVPQPQEMKEDLLKTLPQSFREQLMWHATSASVDFDQFAEHIKQVSYDMIFLQGKAVDVNNVEVEHQRPPDDHHPGDGDGEGETYEEAMMAVNFRFGKGAGKGGRRDGGKGGGKGGSEGGPRGGGTGDVKCGNCGASHLTAACTRPRVPLEDRLCHGCGKPGHISRNCPQKQHQPQRRPVKNVNELPVDFFGCVLELKDEEGFTKVAPRRPGRPMPTRPMLADWVLHNKFATLATTDPAGSRGPWESRLMSRPAKPSTGTGNSTTQDYGRNPGTSSFTTLPNRKAFTKFSTTNSTPEPPKVDFVNKKGKVMAGDARPTGLEFLRTPALSTSQCSDQCSETRSRPMSTMSPEKHGIPAGPDQHHACWPNARPDQHLACRPGEHPDEATVKERDASEGTHATAPAAADASGAARAGEVVYVKDRGDPPTDGSTSTARGSSPQFKATITWQDVQRRRDGQARGNLQHSRGGDDCFQHNTIGGVNGLTSSLTSCDVQGDMGFPADELPSETSRELQRAERDFDAHLEGLREAFRQKAEGPVIRNSAAVTINHILAERRRNEPNQAQRNDALNHDDFARMIDEEVDVVDEVVPEEEVLSTNEAKVVYVAADTGAVEHCIGPSDLPGSVVVEPPERERHFVGAQGKGIDHYGKAKVILETVTGQHIGNVFQVMDVCRPLHAVSKITDTGHDMLFTKRGAVVVPEGAFNAVLAACEITAKYPRKGGLYVAKMTAKPASEPPSAETPATATFAGQGVGQ